MRLMLRCVPHPLPFTRNDVDVLPTDRHRYGGTRMYQSSRPLPYYPTFGGLPFSSRTLHGLRVGSSGLL